MLLVPSIASANTLALKEAIDSLEDWPLLHIDIDDGNFTPNITFGLKTLKAIVNAALGKSIDVHLMCMNPLRYLEELGKLGINRISAHIEALDYPLLFINKAHDLGIKAGLALNIKTPANAVEPFYPVIDHVMVMSAEPDCCGEKLYAPALDKAVCIAGKKPCGVSLFVDGALDADALKVLQKAGATGAILGRLVFDSVNPLNMLKMLETMLNI